MRPHACRLNKESLLGLKLVVLLGLCFGIVSAADAGNYNYVPNEYIINVQSGTSSSAVEMLVDNMGASIVKELPLSGMYHIKMGRTSRISSRSRSSLSSRLAVTWAVDHIQPNYVYTLCTVPNDPGYENQWGMEMINMPDAWNIEKGVESVRVGVIDTGVANHPDLEGRISSGYDFVDDDSDPSNDLHGHGTFVSGIIAAQGDNDKGVVGVCWDNVQIVPIRAFEGSSADTDVLLEAEQYALDQGVDVLNMSYGSYGDDAATDEMMKKLYAAGVILVAAAGNEETNLPSYPASCDGVISVSALGPDESLAYYSNYGSTIDIAAPGGDDSTSTADQIYSTVFSIDDDTGEYYYYYGYFGAGTSYACPHVAGAAAILLSYGIPASEVTDRLLKSARPPKTGALDPNKYGAGVLDVKAALTYGGVQILQPSAGGTVSSRPTFKISLTNVDTSSVKVYLDYPDTDENGVPDDLTDTSYVILDSSNISAGIITATWPLDSSTQSPLSAGDHSIYVRASSTAGGQIYSDWAVFSVASTTFSSGLYLISLPYNFAHFDSDGALTMTALPENLFLTADGESANFADTSKLRVRLARWSPKTTIASGAGYLYYPDNVLAWENPLDSNSSYSWYTGGSYNQSSGVYSFPVGTGFWLMVPSNQEVVLNSAYSAVLESDAYNISLYKGWNMFGNPYDKQVSWSNAFFTYKGITKTLADAQAAGWIGSSVYYYTQTPSRGYHKLSNRDALDAYMGYWLYARVGGVTSSDSLEMTILP
ncbi:S8 family serine peptidase [bacterium]|nr:S8 family serine peptidase [bacterium]